MQKEQALEQFGYKAKRKGFIAAMKSARLKTEIVTGEKLLESLFPDLHLASPKLLPPAPRSPIADLKHWRRSPEAKYVSLRAQLIQTRSSQRISLNWRVEWVRRDLRPGGGSPAPVLAPKPDRRSSRPTKVPVDRVLPYIWHHVRIARSFNLAANGTKPPPISAYEVRFAQESFFLVYDGHHRTEACKMRGDAHVAAVVEQVFVFDPKRWSLIRRGVRSVDGETVLLPEDERTAARWLGIRRLLTEERR